MINDIRTIKDFKDKTFSGYKKTEVISILFKSIESKNIDACCNWIVECIISGYSEYVWNKLCIYCAKNININNTELTDYILKQNKIFYNILDEENLNKNLLNLRNNRIIYNIFISTIIIIIDSSKNFKYKIPNIKKNDFNTDYVRERLTCPMNLIPENKISNSEPQELKLILNEILYNIKDNIDNYDKCFYWIYWILQWEKINLKNKIEWNILERNTDVDLKYRKDVIWLIWEIILDEAKSKSKFVKDNINNLYKLYIFKYKKGDKMKRLPYLLNCILFLVKNIIKTTLIKSIEPIIKCQCNLFLIIKSKKKYEKKPIQVNNISKKENLKIIKNKKQLEENIQKEKTLLKLQDFNEISKLL